MLGISRLAVGNIYAITCSRFLDLAIVKLFSAYAAGGRWFEYWPHHTKQS